MLETNVPKSKTIGVIDDKLASAIQENLGLKVVKNKNIIELTRGIRAHLHNFLKVVSEKDVVKAELGLSHSYSRSKVKFNVNKVDNMIIQAIFLLDQLEKDINMNAMRMREWYGWHFPELSKLIDEHGKYAACIKILKDRSNIDADKVLKELADALDDEEKAKEVIEAAKTSTGYEISDFDMKNILTFAEKVLNLSNYRKDLQNYLSKKMSDIAPNLRALVGDAVGARLISHAGSLTNLAKYPASTVQILGAEKALFRALKTRGNTPKYGLIYNSTFIGRAGTKNKGRISRYLANKCSIASRIDCFAPTANVSDAFGKILKEQVEERLKFYDDGTTPRKNEECMKSVIDALKTSAAQEEKAPKAEKTSKKEKKEVSERKKDKKDKTPKKEKKEATEEKKEKKEKTPKKEKKEATEEKKEKKDKTPKKEKKEATAEKKEKKEKTPKKEEKKKAEKRKSEAVSETPSKKQKN